MKFQGIPQAVKYGEMLELSKLTNVVNESQGQAIPIKIHQRCQKRVFSTVTSHERSLKSKKPSAKIARLSRRIQKDARSDWKSCCWFCAQPCPVDERHLDRSNFADVPTKILLRWNTLRLCCCWNTLPSIVQRQFQHWVTTKSYSCTSKRKTSQ